ncbi:MAG TPA: hypothetical protein VE890_18415 [Thermoguttaceae bacterium]|nr:hypothetical protein [Thermoguttaceae bacterium]
MKRKTLALAMMLMLAAVAQVNGAILIAEYSPSGEDGGLYSGSIWADQFGFTSAYALYEFSFIETPQYEIPALLTPRMETVVYEADFSPLCEFSADGDLLIASVCETGQALGFTPEWLGTPEAPAQDLSLASIASFHHVMPEPATLAIWSLIGLAFAGAGAWRRRSGSADWSEGSRQTTRQPARQRWSDENRAAILDIVQRGTAK